MLDIVLVLLALAVLLLLVSLLEPLAERFQLPGSLLLALLGMAIGLLVFVWGEMPTGGPLGDMVAGLEQIGLSAEAFLYLFLPPLLFTFALGVDLRLLKDEAAAVLLLAVVAVVVCAATVGLFLTPLSDVGLIACLLLGAVVATTDPAAVISLFRDIGAPRRLTTLVSGESLFNDAAAIVLFTIFVGLLSAGEAVEPGAALLDFVETFCGGILVGLGFGKLTSLIFSYLRTRTTAAVTVSVAVAYLSFVAGEIYFEVSGVVAVVTAALVISVDGPTRLVPSVWESLHKAWEQLEFWANSLIFVLASMLAVRVLPNVTWNELGLVAAVAAASLSSRAAVLFLLLPLLSRLRLVQPVSGALKAVIVWGGLRGAVTLVLALSLEGNNAVPIEIRHFVAVLATGYVLFTLLVQAPTLKVVMRLLGLHKLAPVEQMLRDRVLRLSRDAVRREVAATAEAYGFSTTLAERLLPKDPADELPDDGSVPLEVGLLALVAYEKELYLGHFRAQTLSRRLVAQLATAADRLQDAVGDDGLAGYDRATQRILRFSRRQRRALWLQRNLRWSHPLASALADRFESLVISQLVARALMDYAKTSLKEVMGEGVAAELEVLLARRLAQIEVALFAVETRYPSYAEALRAQYLARVALRLQDQSYQERLEQALISREVYADLQRDLKTRWEQVNRRPSLDLGLDLADMIARVSLFHDLPRERLRPIAAQLRPDLAVPGERIIQKGTRGSRMYFLVSGEVAVVLPQGGEIELGPGSFFGEMALLSNAPRNADVVARGFCHLLVLEARDFRRVVRADAELNAKIEAVAAERKAGRS